MLDILSSLSDDTVLSSQCCESERLFVDLVIVETSRDATLRGLRDFHVHGPWGVLGARGSGLEFLKSKTIKLEDCGGLRSLGSSGGVAEVSICLYW